jgi:hypothetical protein
MSHSPKSSANELGLSHAKNFEGAALLDFSSRRSRLPARMPNPPLRTPSRHKGTADLATPQVASLMRAQIEQAAEVFKPSTPDQVSLGLIDNWKRTTLPRGERFCLETDEAARPCSLWPGGLGHLRIIDAKAATPDSCGGAGSHS